MTQSMAANSKPAGLGRYRFRELLSTSFFGARYRVTYEGSPGQSDAPPRSRLSRETSTSDQPLALRLIEVDAPGLLERLAHGIQAMREVENAAILQPLQIVRSSTRLGIVTPDIEGVTLAKLLHDASLREESIRPSIALRITNDVLDGLQALRHHGHGFLRSESTHGGVTPDSIHIGLDGQARYLDPGVASAAARQPRWSHEAAALAYTAPEQTGADALFDACSDNFSLGVVLWEILTLRALFGASTAAETLQRLHQAPIPRVQRQQFVRGEPIAFALAQVVAQALRRDPKQRFGSYDEFGIALQTAGPAANRDAVSELVRRSLHSTSPEAEAEAEANPSQVRASLASAARAASERVPQQSTGTSAAEAEAAENDFEPPTTRISELPRDDFWPANAAWVPAATPEPTENITAFPVGDLLRTPHATRRNLWSLGAASAAALVLTVVFWPSSQSDGSTRLHTDRAAVSSAAPDALEPPARAVQAAPTPTAQPAPAPTRAIVADAGTKTELPARRATKEPATRFHRLPKAELARNAAARAATPKPPSESAPGSGPGANPAKSAPAPFVPDDI